MTPLEAGERLEPLGPRFAKFLTLVSAHLTFTAPQWQVHRPRRDKAEQQDGTLKGAFAVFHISIPENYRDKLVETDDRGKSDRR
ncbi:hypothetical protein PENSOL_c005G10104 [Penicillium solitum]|uniref:Uncharacterized protein n=1 Tax=Penicillium solitum TaxID=60172 RepID=A0A1V6RGM6_9EURO|nr:uncharacterized protein PENSOL_c005G10104 [Penicillium solitum]OQE00967.1 hypothetical protein PENSOL_c005G10104 [Penicillium solitum]